MDHTLGEIALGVSILVGVIGLLLLGAFRECFSDRIFVVLLLTASLAWAWFPFVVYGMYWTGRAIVNQIDEFNRQDIVIPERPKIRDMNKKAEKE